MPNSKCVRSASRWSWASSSAGSHSRSVARADHVARVFNEAVAEPRDVNEPVLMHADVDERAEVSHVGDNTRTSHSGLEILDLVNVLAVGEGRELVARIAPGFGELCDDVREREFAYFRFELFGLLDQIDAAAGQFAAGLEVRYSDHVRAIAQEIPLDRLLTETDNPGGPKGYLGGPGMPLLIEQVVEGLAEARAIGPEAIRRAVQENLSACLTSHRSGSSWHWPASFSSVFSAGGCCQGVKDKALLMHFLKLKNTQPKSELQRTLLLLVTE